LSVKVNVGVRVCMCRYVCVEMWRCGDMCKLCICETPVKG